MNRLSVGKENPNSYENVTDINLVELSKIVLSHRPIHFFPYIQKPSLQNNF
jgi:hypothetical protein